MRKLTLAATALTVAQRRSTTDLGSDDTTRIVELALDTELGGSVAANFPSQPIVPVTYESDAGRSIGGVTKWIYTDGEISGCYLDRGYAEEKAGEAQPETYPIPLVNSIITLMNTSTRVSESHTLLTELMAIVGIKLAASGENSIFEDVLDAFTVTQTTSPSTSVKIGTGVAYSGAGTFIVSDGTETYTLLYTGMTATNKKKVALWIDPITGQLDATYGVQHADTPVAPAWPSGVIRLALITITNGDSTIVNADIDMEREGFTGDA